MVVQTTKMGLVFVLHRETGVPVLPVEERPVPREGAVPGERISGRGQAADDDRAGRSEAREVTGPAGV